MAEIHQFPDRKQEVDEERDRELSDRYNDIVYERREVWEELRAIGVELPSLSLFRVAEAYSYEGVSGDVANLIDHYNDLTELAARFMEEWRSKTPPTHGIVDRIDVIT